MGFLIILFIAAIITALIIVIVKNSEDINVEDTNAEDANELDIRLAGMQGEEVAANIIKSVLREGDLLFTNIKISFNDKPTELDNVIVNHYGVFIIEVKNYKGCLYGNEDDYEWIKYKDDGYGNTFEKRVKNPIRQVKRQIYILAKYLDYCGVQVWVEGFAVLMQGNSPIESKYILSSIDDIERAIHTPGRNRLTKKQVETIANILQIDNKTDCIYKYKQ